MQPIPYVAYCFSAGQVACYIGRLSSMPDPRLSHTAALILQAIHAGHIYGFSVMEVTGLPSGTVYPAMRRLERGGVIVSRLRTQSRGRCASTTSSPGMGERFSIQHPSVTRCLPS